MVSILATVNVLEEIWLRKQRRVHLIWADTEIFTSSVLSLLLGLPSPPVTRG